MKFDAIREFVLIIVIGSLLLVQPIKPTAIQAEVAHCPRTLSSRLSANGNARVTNGAANRLRKNPSATSQALAFLPAETIIHVVDGPTCAENYAWWQVKYNGQVGWTVEGDAQHYWLEPVTDFVTNLPVKPTPDKKHPQQILVSTNQSSANYGLKLIDPQNMSTIQLTNTIGTDDDQASWSPDGTQILFVSTSAEAPNKNGIYLMNVDGTGITQLVPNGLLPVWSPDGKKIAYSADENNNGQRLFVMNADTTNVHAVISGSLGVYDRAVWAHNRGALLYSQSAGDGYTVDLADNASGENTQPLGHTTVWSEAQFHFASSQIALFEPGQDVTLSIYNLKSRTRKALLSGPKSRDLEQFMAWSPDGTRLAGAFLTTENGQPSFPLYTINANGSNFEIISNKNYRISWIAWAPDGKNIAFGTFPDTSKQNEPNVYLISATGGEPKPLIKGINAVQARWSPDGSQLALIGYSSSSAFPLDIIDVASPKLLLHLDSVRDAQWRPSG